MRRLGLNKKGQNSFTIFNFMIVSFLAVIFFGGLIWVQGLLNDVFTEVGVQNELAPHPTYQVPCITNQSQTCNVSSYVNMSLASEQIFGQLNDSIQALRLVALVYILGLAAIIIITSALVRTNPLWFFAYILLALLAVIFAPTIANAYEGLISSGIFDNEFANSGWATVNFIMLNLPTVVLIISIFGAVLTFVNLIRGVSGEGDLS